MRKRRRYNLSPVDKATLRLISRAWVCFAVALVLALLMQLFVSPKGYFKYDGYLFFNAIYGFISCIFIIVLAWALGLILKRQERYYEDQ